MPQNDIFTNRKGYLSQESVRQIKEIAHKRGPKKGENYDVSHLDLTASPTLIPSPREDEDWGE